MGVVLALFLPDSPLTARFLNTEEKKVAIERIRSNQQSVGTHDYKLYQVKEAFMDPMVSFQKISMPFSIEERSITNFFTGRHGYTPYMRLRSISLM